MTQAAFVPTARVSGLRRVITCRVPAPAYDKLRGKSHLLQAAAAALKEGLELPLPEKASGSLRFSGRPLAIPISADIFDAVSKLAQEFFNSDLRETAGWLIARGLGMKLTLPVEGELLDAYEKRREAVIQFATPPLPKPFILRPQQEPRKNPLPANDSAPALSGKELAERRRAIGLSQRDLAHTAGVSRGLVAEIEKGRRLHVPTRLRIAEALERLKKDKETKQ